MGKLKTWHQGHCLQECGVVHMASLAQRFSLAGDLLQSVIEARIGHSIKGRLQAGLLFTPAYINRIKAQVLLQQSSTSKQLLDINTSCG